MSNKESYVPRLAEFLILTGQRQAHDVMRHYCVVLKVRLIGLLIFLAAISGNAQGDSNLYSNKNLYDSVSNLKQIEKISSYMVVGVFYIDLGYSSFQYHFDSTNQYKQKIVCCVCDSTLKVGQWQILGDKAIALITETETLIFDLVEIGQFYFLVPQVEREKFHTDFNDAIKGVKTRKLFKKRINDVERTFLACQLLSSKYYTKDTAN